MKIFVNIASYSAGIVLLLGAVAGLVVAIATTPPKLINASCPFSFQCSAAGVPTWVICLIPLLLFLMFTLLTVALAKRQQNTYAKARWREIESHSIMLDGALRHGNIDHEI